MSKYLEEVTKDIALHREEVIKGMVQLSLTDVLLFWGQQKELIERQKKAWEPILKWVNEILEAELKYTSSLDIPEQPKESGYRLQNFLEKLSDKELAGFYVAALNMKSVLLAAALVKGKVNSEEAFKAAFLEELWQNENWGVVDEAMKKREEMKQELVDVENFLK